MKQFVFVYLGGTQPTDPEKAHQHVEKYMDWLRTLAPALVVPTIPLKDTTTVSASAGIKEGGSSMMSGFSIIKAESMQTALKIAQTCPFLEIGGTLEVSELMDMPAQ